MASKEERAYAVKAYLDVVDHSLDILSQGKEGSLTNLPSWVLCPRLITIASSDKDDGIALRVEPREDLNHDVVVIQDLKSQDDLRLLSRPIEIQPMPNLMPDPRSFTLLADPVLRQANNPMAPPNMEGRFLIGFGREEGFFNIFNEASAKKDAVNLWNACLLGKPNENFISILRGVFGRLHGLTRRRSFLERRIHRFLREFAHIIMPPHQELIYEYRIRKGDDYRVADFIIRREKGFPALLIELESPVHKVFTRTGDFTREVNHARQQINEWVNFIDDDPMSNASGSLSFLRGRKDRLIIIGRGTEQEERLLEMSKADNITVITYDMLIAEAKRRWDRHLNEQYRLLGLPSQRIF